MRLHRITPVQSIDLNSLETLQLVALHNGNIEVLYFGAETMAALNQIIATDTKTPDENNAY